MASATCCWNWGQAQDSSCPLQCLTLAWPWLLCPTEPQPSAPEAWTSLKPGMAGEGTAPQPHRRTCSELDSKSSGRRQALGQESLSQSPSCLLRARVTVWPSQFPPVKSLLCWAVQLVSPGSPASQPHELSRCGAYLKGQDLTHDSSMMIFLALF